MAHLVPQSIIYTPLSQSDQSRWKWRAPMKPNEAKISRCPVRRRAVILQPTSPGCSTDALCSMYVTWAVSVICLADVMCWTLVGCASLLNEPTLWHVPPGPDQCVGQRSVELALGPSLLLELGRCSPHVYFYNYTWSNSLGDNVLLKALSSVILYMHQTFAPMIRMSSMHYENLTLLIKAKQQISD